MRCGAPSATHDFGTARGDDDEGVEDAHDQQREAGFAVAVVHQLVDLVHRVVERAVALPRLERRGFAERGGSSFLRGLASRSGPGRRRPVSH